MAARDSQCLPWRGACVHTRNAVVPLRATANVACSQRWRVRRYLPGGSRDRARQHDHGLLAPGGARRRRISFRKFPDASGSIARGGRCPPEVSGSFRTLPEEFSAAAPRRRRDSARFPAPRARWPACGPTHARTRRRVWRAPADARIACRHSALQRGLDTVDANTHLGFEQDTRRRGSGSSRTAPHATMPPCQRATCNRRHATCNMQHATDSMQQATDNMQHAASSMQHAA